MTVQGEVETTSEVRRALHALEEQVQAVWSAVIESEDGQELAGAGMTVEKVTDLLDLIWSIVKTVMERSEQILERDVTERIPGSSSEVLETALVHLAYGHEGLGVARHLLGVARGDLSRLEREKSG
ncbi:hypothetical protein E1293_20730 [Actinomadura darangshiensis]|uniref:Uncharacterized protein n=1 Tax=Actinomadura darangshiensis TaxID=705336 RepID=A0A4R5B2V4_9ACTN|nr:hypothetical protein [Actinomadura darangshiensis]TDD80438.1 hypothetical protein E1293_20730 [Actinomadura darangshiensis]